MIKMKEELRNKIMELNFVDCLTGFVLFSEDNVIGSVDGH